MKNSRGAQSYERALEWFHKSAEQGNPDAQCEIGIIF